MTKKPNRLIHAASETDANLYYATHFLAPDPFVFAEIRGKKYALLNDLEIDRAKKESSLDVAVSISHLAALYFKKNKNRPSFSDLIAFFLKSKKEKTFLVPYDFPLATAMALQKKGLRLKIGAPPFYESRLEKNTSEVRAITKAIRVVENVFGESVKMLKKSKVKNGKLYLDGKVLTSEKMQRTINLLLMKNNCAGPGPIVSCGKHSVDPHDEGSGPLLANQPIIFDIFPRDLKTRYFADFTRTVVKGKATPRLKKMYAAVHEAQKIAFRMIRPGADAGKVHQAVQNYFLSEGFETGLQDGRMQGFFHGTGHGLGLDIHELPGVGGSKNVLKEGHVITVEPGLYYKKTGGIRLEDVVVVTKAGCRNLTRFPKFLEL